MWTFEAVGCGSAVISKNARSTVIRFNQIMTLGETNGNDKIVTQIYSLINLIWNKGKLTDEYFSIYIQAKTTYFCQWA